ncbi:rhomboid family intramembrane serine protease [Acinetobacter sp. DSM 11652]|uniref:rhomboid family intramembrane serine protease n=1 Tax=Acinetobacter sp. DSM 11652 TaxID=346222 RepID=UPI0008D3BF82|nr:rhomboid family intramembrane serine protease [Acinetobacter sp. DSM 11652]SEL77826.1 rhomboid protease GluP [Acinetobacter sp. DSM 11652]
MTEMQPPQFQSQSRLPLSQITFLIITLNVGLFIWQIFSGVDISNPATIDALRWGADYAPLTYLEEPLRIFSSTFFHFGLIHLMLNMWALYIFGNVAEKTLGHVYFLGLYLLAGIMGSLISGLIDIRNSYELLEHVNHDLFPRVSAGASGAVMGLGGALTLLSLFPPLPQQQFLFDRKSLLIILALNIGMGFMIPGINNAAHIGGMLMGAVMALCWYIGQRFRLGFTTTIVVLPLGIFLCWFMYQYNLGLVSGIQPIWAEMLQQMKMQLAY